MSTELNSALFVISVVGLTVAWIFFVEGLAKLASLGIDGLRSLWLKIPIGTKSVLFGAHCFFLHPWFVAAAWTKLYGFPLDPRIWLAFFVHDIGYWGKPNMDGPEGEKHPEVGARIMAAFFDTWELIEPAPNSYYFKQDTTWRDFCLYHSRYYSKAAGAEPSRLCFADKLSFCLTPWWIYLPMTRLTGEINEYIANANKSECSKFNKADYSENFLGWHRELSRYMREWVNEHIDGQADTWTVARHQS